MFKVGHYIRIISPNSEIAYVRAATNGIASLRRDVDGVTETVTDIGNLNLHIFTPEGLGFVLALILRKNTHFRRKKSFSDPFDDWHTYVIDQGENFGG